MTFHAIKCGIAYCLTHSRSSRNFVAYFLGGSLKNFNARGANGSSLGVVAMEKCFRCVGKLWCCSPWEISSQYKIRKPCRKASPELCHSWPYIQVRDYATHPYTLRLYCVGYCLIFLIRCLLQHCFFLIAKIKGCKKHWFNNTWFACVLCIMCFEKQTY